MTSIWPNSDGLKVGDLCEIVVDAAAEMSGAQRPSFRGLECTIVSVCQHPNFDWHVTISGQGSRIYCAQSPCLRKKKPPRKEERAIDRKVLWSDGPWQPAKEKQRERA